MEAAEITEDDLLDRWEGPAAIIVVEGLVDQKRSMATICLEVAKTSSI